MKGFPQGPRPNFRIEPKLRVRLSRWFQDQFALLRIRICD
jgi:hypothetical protein